MATVLRNLTNMPKIPGITSTAPPPEPAAAMTAEAEKIRPKLEEVGTRRAAAETEVGKLAAEKEQFGAEQAVRKAEGEAQVGEKFAQTMREAPMRTELEEKTKQEKDFFFQPSQQDGMQFATLASLLMVLGTSIGKGGKGNAIAALNGLNGMMEGYRKQSDSVYKQEKAAFETNAKALKDQITALRQSLQDYEKMASVDRQAATQKLDLELAKQGADFMKSRVQRQGVAMLLPELRQQEKHLQTLLDGYDKKIAEAKDKASAASALERQRAESREESMRLAATLRGTGRTATQQLFMAQRAVNALGGVASAAEGLMKLPAGTTMQILPNLTTKDGMFNFIRNAGARTMTASEAKAMETLFTGVTRNLAAIEASGAATGLVGLSGQLEKLRPVAGDKAVDVALKMADIRRIAAENIEPLIQSGLMPKQQADVAEGLVKRIEKAIPFTTTDVIDAAYGGKGKTMGESGAAVARPPQAFNTAAEAEAANLPKGTVITIGGRRAVVE